MRIFIALQPAPAFLDALAFLQDRLRTAGGTGRYLTPANLHLSLAFIGMWPKDVCLCRSDHGEQGMAYTVIGRSKQSGE